ncbi:hypothetical protein SERLA73DRAFT_71468 [Serpula lacrymans var. lacrymans S7.3]|uniref:Uncharacterized protein n=2 Tax=Serpula lacrymans var. lacrymans TaxID=341189 RepID=F8PR48_SERL3|nr:uncharacterized protein SERLADRAFT_435845 [Serpula lacrymans var. lacrymans S7.9]EGO02339.1 hypothetical protein SERLA73DRAFT_71468 [Serpula lacrymans var. lacrymans S7.3]EGO28074.1 hypothetical protein SERLADRAFT_435845 [Serpula lacrymans var. lacrymans S7.9]
MAVSTSLSITYSFASCKSKAQYDWHGVRASPPYTSLEGAKYIPLSERTGKFPSSLHSKPPVKNEDQHNMYKIDTIQAHSVVTQIRECPAGDERNPEEERPP